MPEKPHTTADEMLAVEAYRSAPCPVCGRSERCRCRVPAEKAHYRIVAVLDALTAAGWQPPEPHARLRDANDTLALTLAEAIGALTPDGDGYPSPGAIDRATVDRWRRALHEAETARTEA